MDWLSSLGYEWEWQANRHVHDVTRFSQIEYIIEELARIRRTDHVPWVILNIRCEDDTEFLRAWIAWFTIEDAQGGICNIICIQTCEPLHSYSNVTRTVGCGPDSTDPGSTLRDGRKWEGKKACERKERSFYPGFFQGPASTIPTACP